MKVPKILFPTAHATDYYNQLLELIDEMDSMTIKFFESKVRPLADRNDSFKADESIDEVNRGLDDLLDNMTAIFNGVAKTLAQDFVTRVKQHGVTEVGKQVRAVVGFDPLKRSPKLATLVKAGVAENVSLIKSIPQQYHKDLERIVMQGLRSGESTTEIKDKIKNLYNVTDNRAKLIARDQAGSLLGDVTKIRHQNLGLKKFIWRDSADDRVRKRHQEYDDKIYTWEDGANGEYPGKPIRCRCTAEVVAEELDELWGGQAA